MRVLMLCVGLSAALVLSGCKKDSPTQPQSTGGANVVFDHWGPITYDSGGRAWSTGYGSNTGTATAHNVKANGIFTSPINLDPGITGLWKQYAVYLGRDGNGNPVYGNQANASFTWE